jgi:hypothetical protein
MRPTRFLAGLVVTVLVVEAVARVALAATDPIVLRHHDHTAALKVDQLDDRSDTGLVVIGTSMAQQDLDPSIIEAATGLPSYNAALDGGVPTVMEPWLLGPVLDRVDPEVVVWGLSPLDLSASYGDGVERAYREALDTRPGWLADVERSAGRVSALVSARTVLREPSMFLGDERDRVVAQREAATEALADDGQRLDFRRALGVDREREVAARLTPFAIDRADLLAVIGTVRELRGRGTRVVLVELPVPDRFVELYPDGPAQHRVVGDTIAALGAELGVPVVSASVAGPDLDFVDFTHLDRPSAESFTRAVAAELTALLAPPSPGG